MSSDPTPTRDDRFSFGLWTVGWQDRDPFGDGNADRNSDRDGDDGTDSDTDRNTDRGDLRRRSES